MDTLKIPRTIVNQILKQAQNSPEKEVCGLLGGDGNLVQSCYVIPNDAANPEQRYSMDAKAQIEAIRQIREAGENLVAIYHSHPHSPAKPSLIDVEEAEYSNVAYLIISLNTEGVLEMSAHHIVEKSSTSMGLELF